MPTPEFQLAFLAKLQRLFNEGEFAATYKFALLMAMTELAVEEGGDDGRPLWLTTKALATKFIALYWQQTAPYSSGMLDTDAAVLAQNKGPQAAVVRAIADFRHSHPGVTLATLATTSGFADLVTSVARTVAAQPVRYLQNLGGGTEAFLYENQRGGIQLLPGVAFCLRRFQPLITQLCRAHWVQHIKGNALNLPLLGRHDDLEGFLFETPRQSLVKIGDGLRKLTGGRCFYCAGTVTEADVDHFLPFSLYPRDLAHNFVLAHPVCNRSKSDTLAARYHLSRWRSYVDRHQGDLLQIAANAGRAGDLQASLAVTRWGYSSAVTSSAMAWKQSREYEVVTPDYLELLTT
jgi:5-methylcytosine-specific restriction endonuclease McrA